MKRHYKMFWGCVIPAQMPYIEKAARRLLDAFDVLYSDLEGTTCCPEKLIVADSDEFDYILTAARNIALAEREGRDIMVVCNGCYATLKTASETLKADKALAARVNERLARIGLEFKGTAGIFHLLAVLEEDIRLARLKKDAARSLAGLRVAVHYGCNLLRPASAIRLDDPLEPALLDGLVEALGGVSVKYASKMACCGGNFSLVDGKVQSEAMLARKLSDVRAAGADFILVSCPACFTQFDLRQDRMLRDTDSREGAVPVLHLAELVSLVLGEEPDKAALKRRRVKIDGLLEKWERLEEVQREVAGEFDFKSLARCAACAACLDDCPVALSYADFNPNQIVKDVLEGRLEGVLEAGDFWNCLDCLTCFELCPQRFGMQALFKRLKEIAAERGEVPETLEKVRRAFYDKGRVAEGSKGARRRMGLPETPSTGDDDLKRLLQEDGE